MFKPKPITPAGIAEALRKADRYRLINDPSSAESICLDVLDLEPENQQALVMLLLARTDQFSEGVAVGVERAREVLPRLRDEYRRAYYAGIICERRAKAQLRTGTPGAGAMAYEGLREAMTWYERAEVIRPAGNDEALLRWNTCARILTRNPQLAPRSDDRFEPAFEEG